MQGRVRPGPPDQPAGARAPGADLRTRPWRPIPSGATARPASWNAPCGGSSPGGWIAAAGLARAGRDGRRADRPAGLAAATVRPIARRRCRHRAGVVSARLDPFRGSNRLSVRPDRPVALADPPRRRGGVSARLDAPAYGYLIALDPDGRSSCVIPAEGERSPPRSEEIRYPRRAVVLRLDGPARPAGVRGGGIAEALAAVRGMERGGRPPPALETLRRRRPASGAMTAVGFEARLRRPSRRAEGSLPARPPRRSGRSANTSRSSPMSRRSRPSRSRSGRRTEPRRRGCRSEARRSRSTSGAFLAMNHGNLRIIGLRVSCLSWSRPRPCALGRHGTGPGAARRRKPRRSRSPPGSASSRATMPSGSRRWKTDRGPGEERPIRRGDRARAGSPGDPPAGSRVRTTGRRSRPASRSRRARAWPASRIRTSPNWRRLSGGTRRPDKLYEKGRYAEAEPLFRGLWRSVAGSWARTTPTPPSATTTWPSTSTPRGSTPRPSRCSRRPWRSAAAPWARTIPTPPRATTTWPSTSMPGEARRGRAVLQKALAIRRQVLGEDHPAPPRATTTWPSPWSTRGSMPRPSRSSQGAGDLQPNAGRGPPRHRHQLRQPGRHPQRTRGSTPRPSRSHRKALAIRRRALGEDHPDTAIRLPQPGHEPRRARGSTPRPRRCIRKALAICAAARWARTTPNTAASYNNLAVNLDAQGKYAEAEPLFAEGDCRTWARTIPTPSRAARRRTDAPYAATVRRLEPPPEALLMAATQSGANLARGKYAEAEAMALAAARSYEAARLRISFTGLATVRVRLEALPLTLSSPRSWPGGDAATEAWRRWESEPGARPVRRPGGPPQPAPHARRAGAAAKS